MAQPLTDALSESVRAAVRADELERDRIAWNLPHAAPDETPHPPDESEPADPEPPDEGDLRR